jgi:hypothetical protein
MAFISWIFKILKFSKEYKAYAAAGASAIGGTGLTILFMSSAYTDQAVGAHITSEDKRWTEHLKTGDDWKKQNKELQDARHDMLMQAIKTINDNQKDQWNILGGNPERFRKINYKQSK